MRRFLRWLYLVLLIVIAVATTVGYGLYRASQQRPDFYVRVLKGEPEAQKVAGYQLEQQVLELQNETREPGTWEAVFTEQQLNGWLAADLPLKFPRLLPKYVQDPRVAICEERVQVGCKYQGPTLASVMSVSLQIHLTDEPNTLAVKLENARVGSLPAPLTQFLDRITQVAASSNVPVRWGQTEGDPIALITIPKSHPDYVHHEIHLEHIEIRDGEVRLSGRTAPRPNQPTISQFGRGSVEKIAYQP